MSLYGFTHSKTNASLFVYTFYADIVYFLVYIDDLLVTGNSTTMISTFVQPLFRQLSLKDLGHLSFFLGVEVIPAKMGLFLTHHKYIKELEKVELDDAKDSIIPTSTTTVLLLHDGSPLIDTKQYRYVISAVQYLSLTRE